MLNSLNQLQKTLFYLFIFFPAILRADFVCSSDLLYSWTDSEKNKVEVLFGLYQEKGPTEDEAKQHLLGRLEKEKSPARDSCFKAHESLTDCVSGKFLSNSSLFQSLSFTGRKALEAAINDDCRKALGRCNDTSHSEIKCVEKKDSAAATPTPTVEAKPEKKGKK